MRDTEAILETVIWLIEQCDNQDLATVQQLHFLEIAKRLVRTHRPTSLNPLRKEVSEKRLIPALLTAVARQGWRLRV